MSNPTEKPTPTGEDAIAHLMREMPELFEPLGDGFTIDTTFEEAKLDSLAVVEVALALETRYDVDLPDEALERCKTVGDLVAAVLTQGQHS